MCEIEEVKNIILETIFVEDRVTYVPPHKEWLDKQIKQLDDEKSDDFILETLVIEDASIYVPTHKELLDSTEFNERWQLCEKYENYNINQIKQLVDEKFEDFFYILSKSTRREIN